MSTVARACDAGKTTRFDAAGAILMASENAVKVSLEAVQALGGAGYTKEWPVERLVRDAKLYDIGAGTNEIRRFLIGRELVGADPPCGEGGPKGRRGKLTTATLSIASRHPPGGASKNVRAAPIARDGPPSS
jgi:hypothetical protein